jgi:hypothetical protein
VASQKTTAAQEHSRVYQMLSGLTANMSMIACADLGRIQQFETTAKSDPLMAELTGELRDRLAAVGGPEAFTEMSQAYEAFAEANFAFEMLGRGVRLARTPGTGNERQRRPDFVHGHAKGNLHFEVKALEIAEPTTRNNRNAKI